MYDIKQFLEIIAKGSNKSVKEVESLIIDKIEELSGLVSEEGAAHIVANELGVKLEIQRPKKELELKKINEIKENKIPVSFFCKVLKKYDKINFSSEKSEGAVQSILVGDETGILRVTFWNEDTNLLEKIVKGDILKISNGFSRENTNIEDRIDVHFSQYSEIEINPKGISIEVIESSNIEFNKKKISDLKENDKNILIEGIITDFEIPRFYLGCSQCFRKVFQDEDNFKCAIHGKCDANKIPIINFSIDDGSGIISVVGFRDRAEQITNLKTEEILKLSEDNDLFNNLTKRIIEAKIKIGGNVNLNNMTEKLQLVANQIENVEFKLFKDIVDEEIKTSKVKSSTSGDLVDDIDIDDIDIDDIDIDDNLI